MILLLMTYQRLSRLHPRFHHHLNRKERDCLSSLRRERARKERALVGNLARFGFHSLSLVEMHNLLNSEEQLISNLTSRAHPRLILL